MKRLGGLRKRWFFNTVGVVCLLGLICAALVVTVFSLYYYSMVESDMRYRAANTTNFFMEYTSHNYNDYYQSCINYANTFDDKDKLELQFINTDGEIVATSYGDWALDNPTTSDIAEAIETRKISAFRGKDPNTGERIIAVSSPMVYSSGEVIGVLRYVTSTRLIDQQISIIAFWSLLALVVIFCCCCNG